MHGTCKESEGKFSCECEKNWVGVRCEKECSLECGEHGYCGHAQNGSIACICNWNYTGTWCNDSWPVLFTDEGSGRTGESLTVWQVAAGCLGVVAVLLVLLVLLAYVTWRWQWLPMRKLVHYFQQYEEDDGKEFDAFVSYKSTARDEKFVLQQLYPRLEKDLDFKLCLHFRDFPPGETIADNIIHAIENSRRTIMVLSPAYVQSEWCRLEYQKAQHEMLKLKHKIIPVVLEDVDHVSFVDKNLKNILDTVTYIKWPGPDDSKRTEKFWKLVELSMPKKKNDYTRSLSSTGSCSSEHPLTSVSAACFNTIVDSMSDSLSPQRSLSLCSSSEGTEVDNDKDETGNEGPKDDSSSDSEGDQSDQPSIDEKLVGAWSRNHVTSDDHIVEIREISEDVVRVTPLKPAKSVHLLTCASASPTSL
ncbi:hypothetical protein C0Q70_16653 [Pomacea canaliculata]|uniref:TIR domain-containing protein n=2 Tax=Pomacea canaliculata TaxID=400727 RepID=A0A2T7NQD6_POMCA|nr:hypothetical protein C0Q70_16653 [Pomacea canaliculata]